MRKFEKVSRIKEEIELPKRSTKNSAGYDFFAVEDVVIEPIKHTKIVTPTYGDFNGSVEHTNVKPTLVKTGIKAEMMHNEFLMLANRSSNPKKGLMLANGVGIIDSDYYNNEDNEGEIMFAFININADPVEIKKGEKIGQGIFMKFLKTEDDVADGKRTGGFGSTDKEDEENEEDYKKTRLKARARRIREMRTENEKMNDEFVDEEVKYLNEEGD